MSLSKALWQANLRQARACLDLPFVQGLRSGALDRECFAYYVGQDWFFLNMSARACSIAAGRAPDWDCFRIFHGLAGGILKELELHESYQSAWGVDISQVEIGATTRRYADFLLSVAWNQDPGHTAAAMLPCTRLYMFLGQEMARDGIPDHAYAAWIRTYSNPALEELAQQLELLIDRHAADTPLLRLVYQYAMQCEHDFFHAAWQYRPPA